MSNLISVEEITENDLTYEETLALKDKENNDILSHKVISYDCLTDIELEEVFIYGKNTGSLEWLLTHRPDFIKRCHPEVLT